MALAAIRNSFAKAQELTEKLAVMLMVFIETVFKLYLNFQEI
jgi:hypothetical protein